jgi:thermitase
VRLETAASWGKGVTVALLDSGVTDHPSLKNVSVTHVDLVNDGLEFNGHGTAMASLIAGDDALISGVSPAASILDVRVADSAGMSNTSLLSSAIVYAADSGAPIISISLGSNRWSPVLEQAVRYAMSKGVVVIAAAGNDGINGLSYPAGISGVVSVGAVDAAGKQAQFSNSGAGITLVAPGVGIVSAYANGTTVIGSGTSQATAIVSGTAAYFVWRGYQGVNVPTVLTRSARPTGAPQTAVGAGILHIP